MPGHIALVINSAFTVYRANFVLFCAISFVAALPYLLFMLHATESYISGFSKFLLGIPSILFLNMIGEAIILRRIPAATRPTGRTRRGACSAPWRGFFRSSASRTFASSACSPDF